MLILLLKREISARNFLRELPRQLDPAEIFSVAELNENPLVQRVISVFDTDGNGTVSFIEFLVGLAKLASGTQEEHKINFAFNIYDVGRVLLHGREEIEICWSSDLPFVLQ